MRVAGLSAMGAPDADTVRAILRTTRIDVLVADIYMPGNENLELLTAEELAEEHVAVILITGSASLETALRAFRHDAVDYLTKPIAVESLVETILKAHNALRAKKLQERMLDAAQALTALTRADEKPHHEPRIAEEILERLSAREREVAAQIAAGRGVEDIAADLFISIHTVRNHHRAIYRKLGVGSRRELMAKMLHS